MNLYFSRACLLTCLFFVSYLKAEVVTYNNTVKSENRYSWNKVCKDLVNRASPLIEFKSISELNCMGKNVKVNKFCFRKEAGNPYYARAIVDKKKKEVVCQSSTRVILKWKCEGKRDIYCKDLDTGCFLLKEKMAVRLKLAHKSFTDNRKYLNCYFDTQANEIIFN